MKLSRDPAVFVAAAAALIQFVSAVITPLSVEQQSVLNGVVVALAGFVTAAWLRKDGQVAAFLGLAQAVISLALGFGMQISPEAQAAAMAVLTTAVGMFVRTQAVAPVTAAGTRV